MTRPDSHSKSTANMDVSWMPLRSFENLRVYQKARLLASEILQLTRRFPDAEKFALTDQLSRTTQDIVQSVAVYLERRVDGASTPTHLRDAVEACDRLGLWLDFARECAYLTEREHQRLLTQKAELTQMLEQLIDGETPRAGTS